MNLKPEKLDNGLIIKFYSNRGENKFEINITN